MSEPGRKKQREFFINMLTAEEQQELSLIETRINEKTGSLFVERKNLKSEVTVMEAQAKNHVFTQDERDILAYGATINTTLAELKIKKEVADKVISSAGVNAEKLNNLRIRKQEREDQNKRWNTEMDENIAELELKLKNLKDDKDIANEKFRELCVADDKAIEELEPLVDEKAILEAHTALIGTDKEPGLTERIAKGERIQQTYTGIIERQKMYIQATTDLKTKKARIEQLDADIELDRTNKKKIVSESKNIPTRWGIDDEGVTFDGIPFVESDISTSKSACAIAELMILINQTPIMLMGDAEVLGYSALAELKALAIQHNKIMIFAEHDRQSKDVHLVCYDELDISDEAQPKQNLF